MSESADQARTRRRWITLAEVVAVAGLVIAALGLWMNWSDHRSDEAERATERAGEQRQRGLVTLTGAVERGGQSLLLADPQHTIATAAVQLPGAFQLAPQDAMPGPRIAAHWFERSLLQLTDGGADDVSGHLPVLVTTSWWDGPDQRRDVAIYDILWSIHGRLIGGRRVELTGLTLRSRGGTAAALDRAWQQSRPAA